MQMSGVLEGSDKHGRVQRSAWPEYKGVMRGMKELKLRGQSRLTYQGPECLSP